MRIGIQGRETVETVETSSLSKEGGSGHKDRPVMIAKSSNEASQSACFESVTIKVEW
jgi:hypothetical protein